MPYVTVGKENSGDIEIYYTDWGSGQPIVFSHGWPLSADAFENQVFFLASRGYRSVSINNHRPAVPTNARRATTQNSFQKINNQNEDTDL